MKAPRTKRIAELNDFRRTAMGLTSTSVRSLTAGSENPANPSVAVRVLTIMLASE